MFAGAQTYGTRSFAGACGINLGRAWSTPAAGNELRISLENRRRIGPGRGFSNALKGVACQAPVPRPAAAFMLV